MKNMNHLAIAVVFGALVSVTSFKAYAQNIVQSSRVPAEISVIKSFGDRNDVKIQLSGVLRNSCMSKGETKFIVRGKSIFIKNVIKRRTGVYCLQVLRPYSTAVAIKDLNSGIYDVLVLDRYNKYQDMTSFEIKEVKTLL